MSCTGRPPSARHRANAASLRGSPPLTQNRSEDRSGAGSPAAARRSRSAARCSASLTYIVVTPGSQVTRCRTSASSSSSGRARRSGTTAPPAPSADIDAVASPYSQAIGSATTARSAAVSRHTSTWVRTAFSSPSAESMIAFGRLVVPEVKQISASVPGSPAGDGIRSRRNGSPEAEGSAGEPSTSPTGRSGWRAARIAGSVAWSVTTSTGSLRSRHQARSSAPDDG